MNAEQPQAVQAPFALGRLQRLDARQVWKHEALDFTPWLLAHADLLSDALGVDIELSEREVGVGSFSVDLVGRAVGSDHTVIVENQLAPTDHSHLGQLLTYAAGLEAAYIVWITPEFRDEHRRALDWLNEVTREGVSFFGVVLELLQIVDDSGMTSLPAPHFRLVVEPNDWQKYARSLTAAGVSDGPSQPSGRGLAYQAFFADVLHEIKRQQPDATKAQRVGYDNWFSLPSGRSGIVYSLTFTGDGRFRIELYIDAYTDPARNKALFDWLKSNQKVIEESIGAELTWERLDNRQASRIAVYRDGSIADPTEQLAELKSFAVQEFLRFRGVFGPWIPQAVSATA